MKGVIGLIVGIILGFLLGGLQPRQELSKLQEKVTQLQKDLDIAQKKANKRGRSFMSPIPALNGLEEAEPADKDEGTDGADGAVVVGAGEDGAEAAPPSPPPNPEDARKEVMAAVDVQRARAKQARAALREQADMTPEDMAEFDQIVTDMNSELAAYADEMVAWSEEEPGTRDALGVAHEVTGILYESQSALEELVGADALRDVEESSAQVWNYVDAQPFAEAFLALEASGGGGAGGAGGGPRGNIQVQTP